MSEFVSIYVYCLLAAFVTLTVLLASDFFPAVPSSKSKYLPYESGIRTETNLLNERFALHHYVVALMFLVFDIEVIFLYPWAIVAKQIGSFAFFEMLFFLVVVFVGFTYVWRKGGLEWQ